jgi:glycosyltransferase involved in cell wall biosynthesis
VVAEVLHRAGPRDAVLEIWNGVPWFSPVWHRGPQCTWLHHVHGPMWDLVLPPKLARLGHLLEHRIAPPFYRRSPVVTLSASSREELIGTLGLRASRVRVVPPGIDGRFHPSDAVAKASSPLVVAVGRLMPVKQFHHLVDQVASVRADVPDLQLVIVGDGAERDRLEEQLDSLDARSWVQLPGRVAEADLIDLYRRAWLVASASVAEGWGMTLTEAAACGTPAVATDIGGHRDAVQHGRSGLLVAPDELGRAIARVVQDEPLRRQLSAGALAHAGALTWEATAADTLSVLAEEARRLRSRR